SLTNATRVGYRVRTHFRLRSVPGRLRLSSRVTPQPSFMRWMAALTPRKPAPPVIRMRRSAGLALLGPPGPSVSRIVGSIAAPLTLAGGDAPEERDRHDPARAGEDQRFASHASTA